MGNFLPVEIITNILSRLLIEPLLECSLVCKSWRNIIYNDKLFARMHSRLIYDHDSVAAVSSGKASFVYVLDSVKGHTLVKHMEYDDDNHEKTLKFGITNLIRVPNHYDLNEIIGSCNGLICISVISKGGVEDPVYICNPITREFVYLPKLKKMFRPGDYVVSGFGYHPCTNEYKVVRIYFRAAHKKKPFVGHVQVYTLGSGKGWRNLEDITYKLHLSVSNEILANGGLHWLDEDGKILKFDLSDETFCVLPTPQGVDPMWKYHKKCREEDDYEEIFWDFELRVLGGCLRIIRRNSRWYDIWSFKKRDDLLKKKRKKRKRLFPDNENKGKQDIEEERDKSSWSWAKDTFDWGSVDYNKMTSEVYPFAILKDNATILFHDNDDDLCYYYRQDLAKNGFKIIADDSPPYDSVRYVKSFVSLKALGEEKAKIMKSSKGV